MKQPDGRIVRRLGRIVLLASLGPAVSLSAQTVPLDSGPIPAISFDASRPGYRLPVTSLPTDLSGSNVRLFFDSAFRTQRREHALAGEVVAVVHAGRVLFTGGYGWADLQRRVPADPERTLFRLASITKPFVWTAIMQLVEEGRLDLDAEVEEYIDFAIPDTFDEPIRVWHLLTHTAGFEETWLGWGARGPGDVDELGAALETLLPARVRPVGVHAAYSNYGAALAGYVVQRVSGRTWARYTEDHILAPLGMTSTNARTVLAPELRARHAMGYALVDGALAPTPYRWLQLAPAGHMSSTARDMAVFMLAHLGGGAVGDRRILDDRTARRMHAPLFDPYPELPPLLHGFYRSDRNGRVVFGHGGDLNGFHGRMVLLPEEDFGLFVAVNSDPGAAAVQILVAEFLDHFFGADPERVSDLEGTGDEPVTATAGFRPDRDALRAYVGEYVPLRNAFTTFESLRRLFGPSLVLRLEGDLLHAGSTALVPVAPDRFRTPDGRSAVVFERDDGRVTHALVGSPLGTYQRTRGLGAPRRARLVLLLTQWIAWGAFLGWAYRLARPAPESRRLPSPHVRVAWANAALIATSLALLPGALSGLTLGLSLAGRGVLALIQLSAGLSVMTIAFSVQQWIRGAATAGVRVRYALMALASLAQLWLATSFHLLGAGLF